MDGIELCQKLKNNELTSHIPIILLTAKTTLEDKIHGLSIGADDYVPKPFNMLELKARIANLIEQRKKLRERFSREVTLEPIDISITPLDEKFLSKAISIVEEHMQDENLDILMFRHEMNMTRSTLFRKLYALTGQSPTEFIRTIRLKRAASLLKQNFGNVSQISLEVGFNNLSYFNRSFKKLYGISPMEFAKKN
jgi:DNA-binding response OmpR family regulator